MYLYVAVLLLKRKIGAPTLARSQANTFNNSEIPLKCQFPTVRFMHLHVTIEEYGKHCLHTKHTHQTQTKSQTKLQKLEIEKRNDSESYFSYAFASLHHIECGFRWHLLLLQQIIKSWQIVCNITFCVPMANNFEQ